MVMEPVAVTLPGPVPATKAMKVEAARHTTPAPPDSRPIRAMMMLIIFEMTPVSLSIWANIRKQSMV